MNDLDVNIVATATGATWVSTVLGVVPDLLGASASLIGIIVTILLYRKRCKKYDIEIAILKETKKQK